MTTVTDMPDGTIRRLHRCWGCSPGEAALVIPLSVLRRLTPLDFETNRAVWMKSLRYLDAYCLTHEELLMCPLRDAPYTDEQWVEIRERLGEFQADADIRAMYHAVVAELERRAKREERKARKLKTRRSLQAKYDSTFVALGRRDGFQCAICGGSGADLQIDHIIPIARSGGNDLDNLRLLCAECNRRKSDDIP